MQTDRFPMAEPKERPAPKFRFSGHQTFAFRHGWIEKGVRAVEVNSGALAEDNALVALGVGKNMVESIRHWCLVTQMVEEIATEKRNTGRMLQPSQIARRLLLADGWDPYLEDDASLWLIHWLLVTNPQNITTWQIAFADYQRNDFSKRELAEFVAGVAERREAPVNTGSLSRDVDCFVRTYAPSRGTGKATLPEESFDCPLQSLDLIQATADGDLYRFAVGSKPTLPTAVFGFALVEFFERTRGGSSTLGVQECLYGHGSPGQAFKLDENSLMFHLDELSELTQGLLVLDETAGLKQVYRKGVVDAVSLLARYYDAEARQ